MSSKNNIPTSLSFFPMPCGFEKLILVYSFDNSLNMYNDNIPNEKDNEYHKKCKEIFKRK